MGNPTNFPNRPFRLEAYVWLISQNVAANTSTIGYSLWIKKNSFSPTQSSNTSSWNFWVDGVQINSNTFTYNFTSSDELLLISATHVVHHAADGSASVAFAGNCAADILGFATVDGTVPLPTIPRASVASIAAPFTRNIGSSIAINTNRASSAFTHTITYAFGAASGTVGTGIGASVNWTPPLSLLNQIPAKTTGLVTLTTTTYNGGTLIGKRTSQFSLAAAADIVPVISSLGVVDDNPEVASVVGKFVQGLSMLRATVNAAGVYGSTITSSSFKMGATSVPSGEMIPVVQSGSVPLTASATDTRGRTAAWAGTLDVLPYAQPLLNLVLVRRANADGTVNDNGTSLRVDLNAAVQSLMNVTQRNALTIRVFTRPYGGGTWTARNVINHSSVAYNSNFVVAGGANYPIDDSFDVRVEISDKFNVAAAQTVVATAAVFMHWAKSGVGIGKFHQHGQLDVAGDVHTSGEVFHHGGAVVEPVGSMIAYAGASAPVGWLLCNGQAVSRTAYAALFAVLGTAYGTGNGSTTFNVPDARGRVIVGVDTADPDFASRGLTGGAKTHTLTAAEMPAHTHTTRHVPATQFGNPGGSGFSIASATTLGPSGNTGSAGSGNAHNNLQPFLAANVIIKAL